MSRQVGLPGGFVITGSLAAAAVPAHEPIVMTTSRARPTKKAAIRHGLTVPSPPSGFTVI
jgi:hypothetical protein